MFYVDRKKMDNISNKKYFFRKIHLEHEKTYLPNFLKIKFF